jgi:hypothetical protein
MSETRRTAYATVTVTIDIETGTWGPECTLAQVTKQAEEEAHGRISRMLTQATQADSQLHLKRDTLHGVRITGTSKVSVRLVAEKP